MRVRFGKNGRLRIVSDAGENHAFSTTDPQNFLGPDYTCWGVEQLREECGKMRLDIGNVFTKEEFARKLNAKLAHDQGWEPLDRMVMMRILQLWHWICRFLTYLPHEFDKFAQDIRHFEPAMRVLCDSVAYLFGPCALKTQLLIMRDALPALAWHALARDTTFCLLYTSPSPRDRQKSRMPSSA